LHAQPVCRCIHRRQFIARLAHDKKWTVTVKPYVKKRTLPQNALYWKWLSVIAEETGNDKDILHDFFREKYLPVSYKNVLGAEVKVLTSTADKEFEVQMMINYMTKIECFASSELGIVLPTMADIIEWQE